MLYRLSCQGSPNLREPEHKALRADYWWGPKVERSGSSESAAGGRQPWDAGYDPWYRDACSSATLMPRPAPNTFSHQIQLKSYKNLQWSGGHFRSSLIEVLIKSLPINLSHVQNRETSSSPLFGIDGLGVLEGICQGKVIILFKQCAQSYRFHRQLWLTWELHYDHHHTETWW